jgi:hypothetical protein
MRIDRIGALAFLLGTGLATSARAGTYTFTKVADDVRDNFNLFSFTCAGINKHGAIVFKASKTSPDGFNFFDGIYRADPGGGLTIIAEDPDRVRFTFLGDFPQIDDAGEVSFAANLATVDFENAILRGDGSSPLTIAFVRGDVPLLRLRHLDQ